MYSFYHHLSGLKIDLFPLRHTDAIQVAEFSRRVLMPILPGQAAVVCTAPTSCSSLYSSGLITLWRPVVYNNGHTTCCKSRDITARALTPCVCRLHTACTNFRRNV